MNKLIVLVLLSQLSLAVTAHIGVDFHAKVKVSDKVRNFIRNIQRAAEAGFAAFKDDDGKPDDAISDEGNQNEDSKKLGSDEKYGSDGEERECKRSDGKSCKNLRAINNINV